MSEEQWLSVSDISEKIGVPVETVRRYIRTHGVHMKVKKVHKRYVIHNESVNVFKQIRELYGDGKTAEEIEKILSNRGFPMTVTVKTKDDEPMTVSVPDELQRMNDKLESFSKDQIEFNKQIVEKLDEQKKENEELKQYIKESLEKRDHALMQQLNTRLETAVTKEQENKKGFWSRLFNK